MQGSDRFFLFRSVHSALTSMGEGMTLHRLPTCRKILSLKLSSSRRRGACPHGRSASALLWIRGFEPNRTGSAKASRKNPVFPRLCWPFPLTANRLGWTIKLSPNAKAPAVSDRTWPGRPCSALGATRSPAYPPPKSGAFRTLTKAEAEFFGHIFFDAANREVQSVSKIGFNMESFPRTRAFRTMCPSSGSDGRRRKECI
jgi:hypothetical protein